MSEKRTEKITGLNGYLDRVSDIFQRCKQKEEDIVNTPTTREYDWGEGEIVEVDLEDEILPEDIPDEWVDDDDDFDEGTGSNEGDFDENDVRNEDEVREEPDTALVIDLSKKPATETTMRSDGTAEAEAIEKAEEPESLETEEVPAADNTDLFSESSECEGATIIGEDDLPADIEPVGSERHDDYDENDDMLMQEAETALGEEIVMLVEEDHDYAMDEDVPIDDILEDEAIEIIPQKAESGIGEAYNDVTWSKIPAIYDIRGQEICLGDEMAYRNDYRSIGPVIGIGKDCFFTLTTGMRTNVLGENEIQQWKLHNAQGEKREFYHYNPDSIEKLTALVYDEDYEFDELIDRFRLFISKERKDLKKPNGD